MVARDQRRNWGSDPRVVGDSARGRLADLRLPEPDHVIDKAPNRGYAPECAARDSNPERPEDLPGVRPRAP